jgi:hypothetical protein
MPQHISQDQPAEFQIAFRGFDEAGWQLSVRSVWAADTFDVYLSPSKFLQSIVMAGNLNIVTRDIESNRIAVAIAGTDWYSEVTN